MKVTDPTVPTSDTYDDTPRSQLEQTIHPNEIRDVTKDVRKFRRHDREKHHQARHQQRAAHVHDTVTVLSPDSGTATLGPAFGSREHVNV